MNERPQRFPDRDSKICFVPLLRNEGAAEVDERFHDGTLRPRSPTDKNLLKRRKDTEDDRVEGACVVVARGPEERIAGVNGGLLVARLTKRKKGLL